jgi:hypothetical protein
MLSRAVEIFSTPLTNQRKVWGEMEKLKFLLKLFWLAPKCCVQVR